METKFYTQMRTKRSPEWDNVCVGHSSIEMGMTCHQAYLSCQAGEKVSTEIVSEGAQDMFRFFLGVLDAADDIAEFRLVKVITEVIDA